MEYRQATAADVPALAAMNGQLIRDEGHRNPMTVAELADRMAGWLAGEYKAVLFEEGGPPVGYALYRREPADGYLRHPFLPPADRRPGGGRAAVGVLPRGPGA